eukprot:98856_1
MHIAVQGCCHGELENIYKTIAHIEKHKNIKVDLLLICGDFQSVRNEDDLVQMACPAKYRSMRNFYKYYSGELVAPVTTIFIGGNHEASQSLLELYNGGWVAPNIFFLGFANVVRFGGLRVGGLSGIYKHHDYLKGHHETFPLNNNHQRSIYHIRQFEVSQMKQLANSSSRLDVFLSHDWPTDIAFHGDKNGLLKRKSFFTEDVENHKLGSPPTREVMDCLKPRYHFAAHLHVKFAALVTHDDQTTTKFLALDKCLPFKDFLQVIDIPEFPSGPHRLQYDPEWLSVVRDTYEHVPVGGIGMMDMVKSRMNQSNFRPTEKKLAEINEMFNGNFDIPLNFAQTVEPYDPANPRKGKDVEFMPNAQTREFLSKLGLQDRFANALAPRTNPVSRTTEIASNGSDMWGTQVISAEEPKSTPKLDKKPARPSLTLPQPTCSSSKPSRSVLSLPPPKVSSTESTERHSRPVLQLPPVSSKGPVMIGEPQPDQCETSGDLNQDLQNQSDGKSTTVTKDISEGDDLNQDVQNKSDLNSTKVPKDIGEAPKNIVKPGVTKRKAMVLPLPELDFLPTKKKR